MPLPRSRSRVPASEPLGIVIVTGPVTVGTETRGAEHRLGDADRQLDMDVVAVAAKERVRRDMHSISASPAGTAAKAGDGPCP